MPKNERVGVVIQLGLFKGYGEIVGRDSGKIYPFSVKVRNKRQLRIGMTVKFKLNAGGGAYAIKPLA